MDHSETFGQRVRRLRERKQLTQCQLGRMCGMTQTAIANIENANRSGSRNTVALARALGVDPHFLATGDGSEDALDPAAMRLAHLLMDLNPEDRARLVKIIEAATGVDLSGPLEAPAVRQKKPPDTL